MLVLDHLHHRIHNGLPDETQLNNGQVFNLMSLGLLGVPQLGDYFNELQNKLQDLKFDMGDYVCMKFLILLNPGEYQRISIQAEKLLKMDLSLAFCRCARHCEQEDRAGRTRECAGSAARLHAHLLPLSKCKHIRIYAIYRFNIYL